MPQPSPSTLRLEVGADHDGARLDHFVTAVVPRFSRSQIQRLIKEGAILIGGRTARPSAAVRRGDLVTVDVPEAVDAAPQPEAVPLDIVYDDPDVVVVNKPAGMVVHPAAGHAAGTLVNALLHHVKDLSGIGGERRPGIVHRLDRDTSGLMVVAKHDAAHEALARQFRDREVEKEYVTLVWGVVHAGRRIDAAIGRDPVHRKKMSVRATRAREAATRVTWAEQLRDVSLLHVVIATGRTHQIRVHLSSIGHPVVADPVYGGARRHLAPYLRPIARLTRPFLHAARLAFRHPRDGRVMVFESPLPEDLQSVLADLRALQELKY